MTAWYLDEGLAAFRKQWWGFHPGATVYSIGNSDHAQDPDVSQHAPDHGGSAPGDDRGEVDAVDVMPGRGVDAGDLSELFRDLVDSRDPRILYVIYERQIVSSVVDPWKIRKYRGDWHSHVHLSVNDKYDANARPWRIGDEAKMYAPRFEFAGKLPGLQMGMEDDAFDGYNAVARAQLLANYVDNTVPDVDVDGVYGAKTAAKVRAIMKGGNGKTIGLPEWRKLLGIYA